MYSPLANKAMLISHWHLQIRSFFLL